MSTGDGEGPAWNKFWMSFDHETESMMSGEGSSRVPHTPDARSLVSPEFSRPGVDRLDSVLPTDSASHNGIESPDASAVAGANAAALEETPFPFKFKAPSGRMHRLQIAASSGVAELINVVAEKLGNEVGAVGGVPCFEDGKLGHAGFALSYLDNEGDTVSITTDSDMLEAISLARQRHRDKVDLFVHDPEKPPMPATVAPQPSLPPQPTPPESQVRERRAYIEDSEEEGEDVRERRRERKAHGGVGKSEEPQVIAGVPNELLLPGAIVTLAVVIIGVFAITRATSK